SWVCRAAPRPRSMPYASVWSLPVHLIRLDEKASYVQSSRREPGNRKGAPVMNLPTASTQTTVNARSPGETDSHLRGRWPLLARVVWGGIALLTLGLTVASIPTSLASLYVLCTDAPATCSNNGQITPDYLRALQSLGLSLDVFATYQVARLIVFAVVYTAIATV